MITRVIEVLTLEKKNDEILANAERVEATEGGAGIRITWNSSRRPHGFKQIGGGVAYIQTAGTRPATKYPADPDKLDHDQYAWHDTAHGAGMLLILILPSGYGVDLDEVKPSPNRAKLFEGNLALYWELNPDSHDVRWKLKPSSKEELEQARLQINRSAVAYLLEEETDDVPEGGADHADDGSEVDGNWLIKTATRMVPSFKWAIGAAALFALATIVVRGGLNLGTSVLMVGLLVLVMVILFLFHRLTKVNDGKTGAMALLMSWTLLVLFLLSFVCLFSSSVFNWPWQIRDWIDRQIGAEERVSGEALSNWVKIATAARSAKTISHGRPIPPSVVVERANFEKWWIDTPFAARKAFDHSLLYKAISLNSKIYRVQEIEDTKKANSFHWADEAITFFEAIGSQEFVVESLVDKASIYLDVSDLRHANQTEFAKIASLGQAVMKRAVEISKPAQKPEALRIWSRFVYNLARPQDGILTKSWNNEMLQFAYQQISEAHKMQPTELKNVAQLANVILRIAETPPQDTNETWAQRLSEAQVLIRNKWAEQKDKIADPRDRISPLETLALITRDVVFRTWRTTPIEKRPDIQKKMIEELDQVALPAQREVLSLVLGTEIEKDYAFDIYFDLARMHVVRLLINEPKGRLDPDGDFAAAVSNMEAARKAAVDTQRRAAIDSVLKYRCFSLLGEERKQELLEALRSA